MTNVIPIGNRTADEVRRLHAAMPRKVVVQWKPSPQRTALLAAIHALPEAMRREVCASTGDDLLHEMYLLYRRGDGVA